MGFIKAKLMSIFNTFASDTSKVARTLYIIFLFAAPVVLAIHSFRYPGNWEGTLAIAMIFSFLIYITREMSDYYMPTLGFPAVPKRVTKRIYDGVYVKNSDVNTAIQYLADIEDWAQSKGLTKSSR